jgi:dienelactone hydrolase
LPILVCIGLNRDLLEPTFRKVRPPLDEEIEEQRTFLPVQIGGESYQLETIIVKPTGTVGRLPVAVFMFGQSESVYANSHASPIDALEQARDLAHRGYLAAIVLRRGFGKSDGIPGHAVGRAYKPCDGSASFARTATDLLNAAADDLRGAIATIAERTDADATRVIVIGQSAGGAAALGLAARQVSGL